MEPTVEQFKEEVKQLEQAIFMLVDTFEKKHNLSVREAHLYEDSVRIYIALHNEVI